jgi:hypothetical protein
MKCVAEDPRKIDPKIRSRKYIIYMMYFTAIWPPIMNNGKKRKLEFLCTILGCACSPHKWNNRFLIRWPLAPTF